MADPRISDIWRKHGKRIRKAAKEAGMRVTMAPSLDRARCTLSFCFTNYTLPDRQDHSVDGLTFVVNDIIAGFFCEIDHPGYMAKRRAAIKKHRAAKRKEARRG